MKTLHVSHAASGRLVLAIVSLFVCHCAFFTGHAAAQTRHDNRRLFWTGSNGMEWSAASWKTSSSYLAYANADPASPVWGATTALDNAQFLSGDVAIFDSTGDYHPTGDVTVPRVIEIASAGVAASEVVVSGNGNFVFTGGAITADAASILPGSVQVTGTGTGLAAPSVVPLGRLIKLNTGDLTLSNTAANVFTGGIHLAAGNLTIADNRALGNNNISLLLASTAATGNVVIPATVVGANGALLREASSLISAVTINVPESAAGLDITSDVFLGSQILTLNIAGDTTISGRVYGSAGSSGANGGTLVKTGTGTLTLTGTNNWFFGAGSHTNTDNTNKINAGRLVITSPHAIGTGAWIIASGEGTLEFQGVKGTMKQSFTGGGDIEVTKGSDLTLNWYGGSLYDYESLPLAPGQPNNNDLNSITVSGASRLSAIASGTLSSVLGGRRAKVFIQENSTLVLGREGLSSRGNASGRLPLDFTIDAARVSFNGASTLVLNPNAFLDTAMLDFTDDCTIAFGASGVSRIRWKEGTSPARIEEMGLYHYPEGMELKIRELFVPDGYYREYVVINHGANPLNDIAMTLGALDAVHDTISARLADNFIDPVGVQRPSRGRKWINAAWARYIHSQLDYDNASITTPGFDGRISGAVLGADCILPGQFLAGLHFGAMDNNLSTTNDTSLATKQRFLGIHGAQRLGNAYLAASIDTGRARNDSIRHEPAALVRGKWDTSYYSASIEVGATFSPWKNTIIKPHAGLRYSKIKISNYYERSPSPLLIENFDDTGIQSVYGIAAGRKFTLFKRDLALDLTLARKQTVRAPRETIETHYLGAPDTDITLKRGEYYSAATAAGVSLRVAMSRHIHAGLACDYETSSGHTRFSISGMIGCIW